MTQLHAPDSAAVSGTRIVVQHKVRDRAQFVLERARFAWQLAKHVPAIFAVLVAAIGALQVERDGGGRALAAAELLVGAWVVVIIGREALHLFGRHSANALTAPGSHVPPHEESRLDVPSLAAAALGFVEAWHHARTVGHFEVWTPNFVGGTAALLMAFGGHRAIQKRGEYREFFVHVTPTGIEYKAGPRTSWRAAWSDVAAVEHTQDEIAVRLRSGRRHALRAATFFGGDALLVETRAAMAAHAPAHLAGAPGGVTTLRGLAEAPAQVR